MILQVMLLGFPMLSICNTMKNDLIIEKRLHFDWRFRLRNHTMKAIIHLNRSLNDCCCLEQTKKTTDRKRWFFFIHFHVKRKTSTFIGLHMTLLENYYYNLFRFSVIFCFQSISLCDCIRAQRQMCTMKIQPNIFVIAQKPMKIVAHFFLELSTVSNRLEISYETSNLLYSLIRLSAIQ